MEIISRTGNGVITYCEQCKVYHVEFGNLFFRFAEEGFDYFRNYIASLNGKASEKANKHMTSNRKIFIRLPTENIYFCVYQSELEELKSLVLFQYPLEEEASSFVNGLSVHDLSLN